MGRASRKPYDGAKVIARVSKNLNKALMTMPPGRNRDFVAANRSTMAVTLGEFGALIDAINRNEDARNQQESLKRK